MSTEPVDLTLFVTTDQVEQAVGILRHADLVPDGKPVWVRVDDESVPVTDDWLPSGLRAASRDVYVAWSDELLLARPDGFLRLRTGWTVDIPGLVSAFAAVPFSHLSSEGFGLRFHGPRLSDGHESHGFACAFKGEQGHGRVVSRRWLEHGPWATLHGPEDTTWVLFYDPEGDEDAQIARAEAGHRRMGISPEGGFLQTAFVYSQDLEGFYDSELKRFKKLIHAREPTPLELLEMCAARRYRALGPDKPVERLACVFTAEEPARRWLQELWLRDIECYAIVQGKEVRLDLDFQPPAKPDWALELQARYQPRIDAEG